MERVRERRKVDTQHHLDRGALSSGSHEAARTMEVSADFWG
jgi:hypothetical protein